MLEQFLPIFMRDNSVSDWPSSQYKDSSHPSVGCLANQRHSFPPWKRRETESNSTLLSRNRKYLQMIWDFFLWLEISSCDRTFLPVTEHFFLSQEIYSCDGKFLPVTRNLFLRQEISSCGTKFLTQNLFLMQDISEIFHLSDVKSRQKCVIFGHISKLRQKCVIFAQNFASELKASWQDSCHLARKNPTLVLTLLTNIRSTKVLW